MRCGSSGAWESRCAQSRVFRWSETPFCEMVVRASTLHQEQPTCGRRRKNDLAPGWKRPARTTLCGCYCQRVEVATFAHHFVWKVPLLRRSCSLSDMTERCVLYLCDFCLFDSPFNLSDKQAIKQARRHEIAWTSAQCMVQYSSTKWHGRHVTVTDGQISLHLFFSHLD